MFLIVLLLILFINTHFPKYYIQTGSMEPTLQVGAVGTQSSGYRFGVGAPGDNGLQSGTWGDSSVEGRGGGGGGWYGGQRCTTHTNAEFTNLGGAGGSGHLGNVQSGSMTNGVRSGNGFARITIVR